MAFLRFDPNGMSRTVTVRASHRGRSSLSSDVLSATATFLTEDVPAKPMSVDASFEWCERLARSHYENFPVASLLIPRPKRRYVAAIYAFARIADDFADEGYGQDSIPALSVSDRLSALEKWESQLLDSSKGRASHPVFIALGRTVGDLSLPLELLRDLLSAFKQDVLKLRYQDFTSLLDYCRRSANPVGRLILRVFGYNDEARDQLSDHICTSLQLTNFWQDIAIDAQKNRIYLPQEDLTRFGVTESDIKEQQFSESFRSLLSFEIERTRKLFHAGAKLPELVNGRLKYELRLTWNGGMRMLERIEEAGFDTLRFQPRLRSTDKLRIAIRSLSRIGSS